MSWYSNLSKAAQNLVAIGTLIAVSVTSTLAASRYLGAPAALAESIRDQNTDHLQRMRTIDSTHVARVSELEMKTEVHQSETVETLQSIDAAVRRLDLRLCLEQARRDSTDARACAEINLPDQ